MKPTTVPRRSPRIERTQQALTEALMELIVEQGYERTTVEDILRRADVGRTAFYAHFDSKQDLLLHRLVEISWVRVGLGRQSDGAAGGFDATVLFEHVADQRELVFALRGTAAFEAAMASLRDSLLASFVQLLQARSTQSDVASDQQMTAQALTGALVQLITWWLEAGMPESPRTMASWFAQFAERMVEG